MTEAPQTVDKQLDPRSISLSRTVTGIVAGVIGFIQLFVATMVTLFGDPSTVGKWVLFGVAVVVPGLFLLWAWLWPPLHHRHVRYRDDHDGIWIKQGVWFRTETSIPISRIQHIDVTQGPIARAYGLGTLIVYTAGTQHASESLGGLAHEEAVRIRDRLIDYGESDGV